MLWPPDGWLRYNGPHHADFFFGSFAAVRNAALMRLCRPRPLAPEMRHHVGIRPEG